MSSQEVAGVSFPSMKEYFNVFNFFKPVFKNAFPKLWVILMEITI